VADAIRTGLLRQLHSQHDRARTRRLGYPTACLPLGRNGSPTTVDVDKVLSLSPVKAHGYRGYLLGPRIER
jgi:hypothetical protein